MADVRQQPIETPNAATTTKPERSSKRVAHKAPLGWLPWLALLLLALLVAAIVLVLVAVNRDDSSSSTASTASGSTGSRSSALAAVEAAALVGGDGITPSASSGSAGSSASLLSGQRDPGTAGTVLFAEDSAALDPAGRQVVSTAAAALENAGLKNVKIIGYTDVIAGQPINARLSQQRADTVAQALREALPGVTVTTSAQGEANPIASNSTAAGRQQNRRAAIVAVG